MIAPHERAALAALTFDPAPTPDDVWRPSRYNVPELHEKVVAEILAGVNKARREATSTPLGVAMQGRAGSGKTHLLGAVRERIQQESGYFFLVNLLNPAKFWESTALAIVEGMGQHAIGWGTQLKAFLRRLTSQIGVAAEVRDAISGDEPLARTHLDEFIRRLRAFNAEVGRGCQDTARALVLLGAQDFEAQDVGYAYLISEPGDPDRRAAWGVSPAIHDPELVVRDVSRLMALTLSPTVIAIDQIDTLFAQTSTSMIDRQTGVDESQALAFGPVADGLLRLRDLTRRTLLVVSCLPDVWVLLTKSAPGPVMDRFRMAVLPDRIPTAEIGRAIIAKRLMAMYAERGFRAPYVTWPMRPEAFEDAVNFTPRALLRRVEDHVRWCLEADEIVELDRLATATSESQAAGQRPEAVPTGSGLTGSELTGSASAGLRSAGLRSAGSGSAGPASPGSAPTGSGEAERAPSTLPVPRTLQPAATAADLIALDERFEALLAAAKVDAALDPKTEDECMPRLLAAGLDAWIAEQGPAGAAYKRDPRQPATAALHGRLIRVLDEATENEEHWGFRAIASAHPIAVISRVRAACTASGLDPKVPQRRLVVLRRDAWPSGPRTKEVTGEFAAGGGIRHAISDEDLKVFAALYELSVGEPAHYREWLRARRPASRTEVFRRVFGEPPPAPPTPMPAPATASPAPLPVPPAPSPALPALSPALPVEPATPLPGPATPPAEPAAATAPAGAVEPAPAVPTGSTDSAEPLGLPATRAPVGSSVHIGYTVESEEPFVIGLESLRRHTLIFAGTGSGKTVLVRRLVEECARRGVSAIVLDPNNDLARLGVAWPEPPSAWRSGDGERARDYLANTDVVIWTPRVIGGRPLAFQPLPDFRPLRDQPDEFDQAIRSTVEVLAPRAGVDGATKLAKQGKAVLTEALLAYAREHGAGIHGFVNYLAELPDGVSRMAQAERLAHDAAETMRAATITDPLFGGEGTAADPGILLTPPPGKRARVSVVSLTGFTSDEQRQSFVNQLQMALFAWIRRHPAGDRPLGGLFVMDEAQTFAPASGRTACTASSIALAGQARKYGLGLVFATQAPKGLHNQISGNATTQFFGLLNSPVQIDAARELAQAKGGRLPDIGLLASGEFFVAGEGRPLTKVKTPMCLTYHPKAPLPVEEVIRLARTELPDAEPGHG